MKQIIALLVFAFFCYAYLHFAEAATPSVGFLKKIPKEANYSEAWFKYGSYSYLPVGASYYSPISGIAQFGLKAEKGRVLVGTWRFSKDLKLACARNPYLSVQQLANLYDYAGQCN